jgi:predicted nucleic acid-binding protein
MLSGTVPRRSATVPSRGAGEASTALARLLDDPIHQWVDVTEELVRESLAAWLTSYPDQSFSLVDAVSFEVMRRHRLTVAFAFDRHFEIAGYRLFRYEG